MGFALNALNQLTGINVLIFYSNTIYKDLNIGNPELATFLLGFMNFLASIIINLFSKKLPKHKTMYLGLYG